MSIVTTFCYGVFVVLSYVSIILAIAALMFAIFFGFSKETVHLEQTFLRYAMAFALVAIGIVVVFR